MKFGTGIIIYCLLFKVIFVGFLQAEDTGEIQRLKNELAMEKEASKLLGQKLLKSYEEKVILENQIMEKDEKIKELEGELEKTRKMMESEIASYRKKIGRLQVEGNDLNKKNTVFDNKTKIYEYITMLEEEKKQLRKELAEKQEMLEKIKKEIESIVGKNEQESK